eukprot:2702992-Rhodomonas_salina.2
MGVLRDVRYRHRLCAPRYPLHPRYAMSRTDISYAATSLPILEFPRSGIWMTESMDGAFKPIPLHLRTVCTGNGFEFAPFVPGGINRISPAVLYIMYWQRR